MDSNKRTLYIIRHGQAEHNKQPTDHAIRDPKLTKLGEEQAKGIQLPQIPEIIFVSPLTRTIQTAVLGFPNLISSFHVTEYLQEKQAGELPCDTGRDVADLEKEFPILNNLFTQLPDKWYEPEMNCQQRVDHFKEWIRKREEKVIAVVAHDGVFQTMFAAVLRNGEVRAIEF
jgi:broad specificity phosphatase PhoE